MELQASNFGFQKAKAVISLTNGNLSFNIISYKYNPLVYRAGDITTYTGTTSVYDYQLKKLKDFNYENGQIKQTGLRNNRVDMLIAPSSPPPEPYTNWCSVIPALCDYTNEGGSSDEPFLLTQNPDGGSGGTSGDLPELANNPDANNNIDLNNNNIGGFDNTIYQAFDLATQTWPTIPNVIPKSDFVPLPNPYANCMTLAKLQLAKKLYQISDYLVPGQTIQIYTGTGGANVTKAKEAVSYIVYALQNGIPVLIGVDNKPGSSNPATDNTTDHFVVIVGMGTDANGMFFRFYDNATNLESKGTHDENKLYYNPATGLITGKSQTGYATSRSYMYDYIVTMVRKSKPI